MLHTQLQGHQSIVFWRKRFSTAGNVAPCGGRKMSYRLFTYYGPLGSLSSFRIIWKVEFCLSRCSGAWPLFHSVLVMNRLNTTESAIFIYLVHSLLPKNLTAAEFQWLDYLRNHENMFETGVVRASEC